MSNNHLKGKKDPKLQGLVINRGPKEFLCLAIYLLAI